MAARISIVLSDRNWILERLGLELQARIPFVALNDAVDIDADINYYITFACRKKRVSTLEMGWFAHMEREQHLQELFLNTARDIDLAVCHSKKYYDLLKENGIDNCAVIPPGIDRESFDVKLRIGVVGRTYHTGRKGEGLIAQLMDIDEIDWHFTGPGWPKPNKFIPEDEFADFYRSLDYVLVPALYEGGPMCVLESLAVGTPIIASDVGWVHEFPHIPFKNGDVEDLRRVLTGLIDEKKALRASTDRYTWDAFAEAHDKAFHDLTKRSGKRRRVAVAGRKDAVFPKPVRLLMHGDERTTLGGPSVRVPRTAEALRELGVSAEAGTFASARAVPEDVVHLFNVWHPGSALRTMRRLKDAGKTVIFSPIYLDLGEREFWHNILPELPDGDPAPLEDAYAVARWHHQGRGRLPEAVPGYNAMVREMLDLADHVVFLSQCERDALKTIGATVEDGRASLVHNPVDATLWQDGDPQLFRNTYLEGTTGHSDYLVCIGRIEERKNQLMLARAVKDLPLRLVLIGHCEKPRYLNKIKEEAGEQLVLTGRLDAGSDMLRSALAGAKVFALPSWAEGASLAALEAAAAGANMVLSDRSSEREYFGNLAQYCDPGSVDSIRRAIEAALVKRRPRNKAQKLRTLVKSKHSWEHYARETQNAYHRALAAPARRSNFIAEAGPREPRTLVFDVTTLAHHRGRPTGISRVEAMLAEELRALDVDVRFVCWNDSILRFVEVPAQFAKWTQALRFRTTFDNKASTKPVQLTSECTIVVCGSAWMQNPRYVRGLEYLKSRSDCSLVSLICDLIPFKFPIWFENDYAPVFKNNFMRLATISDHIITISECCARDVRDVLEEHDLPIPGISFNRLGDPVLTPRTEMARSPFGTDLKDEFADKKFVLAVGAIHTRKNYEMLYRVWARFANEGKHADLHLVIVGGAAWNGKPLAEQISRDPRVNRNIHILSNIEDSDLAWLYQQCLFTVFPSHYEGWGLPVAESLVHGKLCLATSASSVQEIAPEYVEHIDPEDFISWATKISFYASSAQSRAAKEIAIRDGYVPLPWRKSAERLVEIALTARPIVCGAPLLLGETVGTNTSTPPLAVHFGPGWHLAESWGRWAMEETAELRLNVGAAGKDLAQGISVLFSLATCLPKGRQQTFRIASGEERLFEADVGAEHFPSEVLVRVPAHHLQRDGTLPLSLSLPLTLEKSKSQDRARTLGIGVREVTVLDTDLNNLLQYLKKTANWVAPPDPLHADLLREDHRQVICGNLSTSRAWGVGNTSGKLQLRIPILPGNLPYTLELVCRPIASEEAPLTANFRFNGQLVAQESWRSSKPAHVSLHLDANTIGKCSPAILTIDTGSLLTPQDLGLGKGNAVSGLGVMDLTLNPVPE